MHIRPGRSVFVPLIPVLLDDPYEVWMCFEENELTGKVVLRKRYVKLIQVGPKEQPLYMVLQAEGGQLVGWTFVPASSQSVLNNQRHGKLVWSRK